MTFVGCNQALEGVFLLNTGSVSSTGLGKARVGWLAGWLAGLLACWLAGWLASLASRRGDRR